MDQQDVRVATCTDAQTETELHLRASKFAAANQRTATARHQQGGYTLALLASLIDSILAERGETEDGFEQDTMPREAG